MGLKIFLIIWTLKQRLLFKIIKKNRQHKSRSLQFNSPDDKTAALTKAINRATAAEENIAKVSNAAENWQSVIDEYKNAIKVDSTYSLAYYKIGYASEVNLDYDNAIKYYNKYLKFEPNSEYKEKIKTNVDKLKYKRDKAKQQDVLSKSVYGLWKSDLKNKKGRPFWIFTIEQFDKDMHVSVSPKSFFYKPTFTYPTAIALREKNKLHFMFTTDATVNPKKKRLFTASSGILNALDGVTSAVSSIPFAGTALSIIGAIPAKAKKIKQTYIFSLDLTDTTKLIGKYNAKKYKSPAGEVTKTLYDSIKIVTFSKIDQTRSDTLKRGKVY